MLRLGQYNVLFAGILFVLILFPSVIFAVPGKKSQKIPKLKPKSLKTSKDTQSLTSPFTVIKSQTKKAFKYFQSLQKRNEPAKPEQLAENGAMCKLSTLPDTFTFAGCLKIFI